MNKAISAAFIVVVSTALFTSRISHAEEGNTVFRLSNFSNEFKLSTPEAINARGQAKVHSKGDKNFVNIHVNGLPPGETYVILNHWFEPIQARGIPNADDGPADDPSCTGHFQFIGDPVTTDKHGKLNIHAQVNQLAPHIWVANFAKFLELTNNGTQAPANADAFTVGGLLIPYEDIVAQEAFFINNGPLTICSF
ncbi:hypothetical protein MNBD_GAMMA07-2786 [hydrothermal vent metagenome]|uniref:CHRD domain-containing protein n=1 Tax=hydrothermal vent metagenome TaxID=652676 RepID=A0A3B0WL79_9ZZZZ